MHHVSSLAQLLKGINQEAYIDQLLQQCKLDDDAVCTKQTPYRSGLPVDNVPHVEMEEPRQKQKQLEHTMRSLVGSLNWLSLATQPDVMTLTNMLAQYQHKPSPGHHDAAKHAIKYLKGTKTLGI